MEVSQHVEGRRRRQGMNSQEEGTECLKIQRERFGEVQGPQSRTILTKAAGVRGPYIWRG